MGELSAVLTPGAQLQGKKMLLQFRPPTKFLPMKGDALPLLRFGGKRERSGGALPLGSGGKFPKSDFACALRGGRIGKNSDAAQ